MHTVFTLAWNKTAGDSRVIHPASGTFGSGDIDFGVTEQHKAAAERSELKMYSGSSERPADCKVASKSLPPRWHLRLSTSDSAGANALPPAPPPHVSGNCATCEQRATLGEGVGTVEKGLILDSLDFLVPKLKAERRAAKAS